MARDGLPLGKAPAEFVNVVVCLGKKRENEVASLAAPAYAMLRPTLNKKGRGCRGLGTSLERGVHAVALGASSEVQGQAGLPRRTALRFRGTGPRTGVHARVRERPGSLSPAGPG